MYRPRILVALVAALALVACSETTSEEVLAPDEHELPVKDGVVETPAGVIFLPTEWAQMDDATREPYLVPMALYRERAVDMSRDRRRAAASRSSSLELESNGGLHVLCHDSFSFICSRIVLHVPGATSTFWSASEWSDASIGDFQAFDMIYLADRASGIAEIRDTRNVWGAATDGRLVLTGVHFEHCGSDPNTGPCRVLIASTQWIARGEGTGLLLSTQFRADGPDLIPTVPPYDGVTYHTNGGGYDHVRITDPGHFTMRRSTDASLSNFHQSSHSIFGKIGGFTNVAEICDVAFLTHPNPCTGTFRPHFLVTSVGISDQDGDGVRDEADNCPTVANADQVDENQNGVGDACEAAPTVTISPDAPVVAPGASITFTTTATDADDPLSSLTYEWRIDGIIQEGEDGTSFTSTFSDDAVVRVTVQDPGLLKGFDESVVTVTNNQPPDADVSGTPTVVECADAGGDGTPVSLVGAGTDPDGTIESFVWTDEDGNVVATTAEATIRLPKGDHTLTLTVTDNGGASDSEDVTISVVDTTPPAVTASFEAVDNDGHGDLFRVVFECSDGCDADPTATADVNGISVSKGQLVKIELDDDADAEFEDGILEIEAPSVVLTVTCTDAEGNTTIVEVKSPLETDGDRGERG